MQVTESEYREWRNHPVTREVFDGVLKDRMTGIGRTLGEGAALEPPNNAVMVGQYRELMYLIDMTYEEMQPEE